MATDETVTISGVVQQLACDKPTFCAGKMYTGGRVVSFSVKGFVKVNEPVTIRGQWEVHPKWGRQFKGTEVVYTMPADPDGMAAWLASAVDGMGPIRSRKMVDAFGVELPRMLAQDPEQVAIDAQLPLALVQLAATAWHDAADRANIGSALHAYGLTQNEVSKLVARYKGSAVTILETDPYLILGDLPGFGWMRVDAIGRKVGVALDHPGRIRAAVITTVTKELDDGSTCVSREGLLNAAGDMLGAVVSPEQVADGLKDALRLGSLVEFGEMAIAAKQAYRTETNLWTRFATGDDPSPVFGRMSEASLAELVEGCRVVHYRGDDAVLDESQIEALELVARNRYSVVTGGAGAGKTLLAKAICDLVGYKSDEATVALCAPTGKAARRLGEVIGRTAVTIHRLLQWVPDTGGFLYGRDLPLPYSVVIVDEVSMVDARLMECLFDAIGPDTAVVMIGDDNQLPPVGAGYPLRDILEHRLVPYHRLTKCHRQAGPLKANCVRVLEGVVEPSIIDAGDPGPWLVHRALETPEKVLAAVGKLFTELLPKWGYAGLMDHQFVTAKHDGQLGTKRLNELLQRLWQARLGVTLQERADADLLPLITGDKVIHTKNNYTLGVMNGTVGVVLSDAPLVVDYDGRAVSYTPENRGEVSLAYCLSVHKVQGSEYPCAIVICPKTHAFMQHRNWLYTGLTRSRQTAILIGDSEGIRRAGDMVQKSQRRTVLELYAKCPEVRPV